jgi:hypothetical protein
MDKQAFRKACELVTGAEPGSRPQKGIGTLGEKTLHSILKHYLEPSTDKHEIRLCGYVADISGDNGIIEVQTRQFNKLRRKLECFLLESHVILVYPVARTKWLFWIDQDTGETTKKRRSPKTGKPYAIFYELYKIKAILRDPNLSIRIIMIDVEEYRYLNGWSSDKKKGSTRCDSIPVDIVGEICINNLDEYCRLIPEGLVVEFTSVEFMKASGLSLADSQTALNVLNHVGAVVRTGKRGSRYIYERTADDNRSMASN